MRFLTVFVFFLIASSQSSCRKMDSSYRQFLDEGVITYTQKVDSLKAYPGRNRVVIAWDSIADPRVRTVNISWLGDDRVIEVPITSTADTLTTIDNLEEGNYIFSFFTVDGEGNRSVKTEVLGQVYNTSYERGLMLRELTDVDLAGTTLALTFASTEGVGGYDHQEITYTSSITNQPKTIQFRDTINTLEIQDYLDEGFEHRSVYLPHERSPDYFYSVSRYEDLNPKPIETRYINPVFEPILADPTVIRAADGLFYAYGTEDNWGDGKGNRLVPILQSTNLVDWTVVGNAFTSKPSWKSAGGIWAVDVVRVNSSYHMYYSYSTWGDSDPGIGLAVSTRPTGPFTDRGKLFLSSEINVPNTIDPYYYEENNKKYLFFGSFSSLPNQGTYAVELSNDGYRVENLANKVKIAAGDFEAVTIHKKDGYYYFFGSKGSCCEGASSTYNVRVGRSQNLLGPYLDKEGRDLTTRGTGTLILQGGSKFVGPGHTSRLLTDANGTDWMFYHAIDKNNATVSSGASRRTLMLDRIVWIDGWPTISNGVPSQIALDGPAF